MMSAAPISASQRVDSLPDGIADYQSHFGLSQSPFDASSETFFGAHGRQALLAQLLHLLHFSDEPSLLVGGPGTGKTSVLQELRRQLAEQDYVFYIQGADISTSSDLLFHIARGIGLAVNDQDSLARLRARLAEWVEFSGGSLQAYILVDDAEVLSSDTIATLLALTVAGAGNCWHLLAAGSDVMVDKFIAQTPESADPAQVFKLPEVTAAFVGDYLSFRLDQAGYQGPPLFDEADEISIFQASAGDLHRAHDSAEVRLLLKLEAAQVVSGARLPLWHLGALFVLVLTLVAAWLGFERPGDAPAPPTRVATEPTLTGMDSVASSLASTPETPVPVPSAEVPAPEPVQDPLMHTGTLVKTEDNRAAAPSNPAPEPVVASPVPASAQSSATEQYTADERDLMGRSGQRYTLQVLAASSKAGVDRFVAEHRQQPLRVYRTRRNGKPWFVVLLGDFSSSNEARSAIQKLPKTLQKSGPWPRDIASIQQQINPQT